MVILKLIVRLVNELDYNRQGESAPGKNYLEIVKDPENTLVGQFVNHFKSRVRREVGQLVDIKYIKEVQDDADIDPEWNISDAFIDHGKAETDKSDQRAKIKLIRKTVEGIPVRAGSVVPDLNLPHFQQPVPRRPPVPIANFGPPAGVLGKRSNATAFADQGPSEEGGHVAVPLQPTRAQAFEHLAVEDWPVSSIERDVVGGSPVIPESNSQNAPPSQFQQHSSDEEPKSESEEEQQVPSTYAAREPVQEEIQETALDRETRSSNRSRDRSLRVLSDAPSGHGNSGSPVHGHIGSEARSNHLRETSLLSGAQQGSAGTRIVDTTATKMPARESYEPFGLNESRVSEAPQSLSSAKSLSRFTSSSSKLTRPNRNTFNGSAFAKSVLQPQSNRRRDAFDVPDSEIEDSQQDPAPLTAKKRRVSRKKSDSPRGVNRPIIGPRELSGLLNSDARVVEEDDRRVKEAPVYVYAQSFREESIADGASNDAGTSIPYLGEQGDFIDVDHAIQNAEIQEQEHGTTSDEAAHPQTNFAARTSERSQSTDVAMEEDVHVQNAVPAASYDMESDSDKENSQPRPLQAKLVHSLEGLMTLDNARLNEAEKEREDGDNSDDDLTRSHRHETSSEDPPQVKEAPVGLSVLQSLKQSKNSSTESPQVSKGVADQEDPSVTNPGETKKRKGVRLLEDHQGSAPDPVSPISYKSPMKTRKSRKTFSDKLAKPKTIAIEVSDDDSEIRVGLGCTQSPSRRRRSSIYLSSLADESKLPTSNVSSTRPYPKGKKIARDIADEVSSSAMGDETPSRITNPIKASSKRPQNTRIPQTPEDLVTPSDSGGSNEPNAATPKPSAIHKSLGTAPSRKSQPPVTTATTSTGKILPSGMTEEEYNRMRNVAPPLSSTKSKRKRPQKATKNAENTTPMPPAAATVNEGTTVESLETPREKKGRKSKSADSGDVAQPAPVSKKSPPFRGAAMGKSGPVISGLQSATKGSPACDVDSTKKSKKSKKQADATSAQKTTKNPTQQAIDDDDVQMIDVIPEPTKSHRKGSSSKESVTIPDPIALASSTTSKKTKKSKPPKSTPATSIEPADQAEAVPKNGESIQTKTQSPAVSMSKGRDHQPINNVQTLAAVMIPPSRASSHELHTKTTRAEPSPAIQPTTQFNSKARDLVTPRALSKESTAASTTSARSAPSNSTTKSNQQLQAASNSVTTMRTSAETSTIRSAPVAKTHSRPPMQNRFSLKDMKAKQEIDKAEREEGEKKRRAQATKRISEGQNALSDVRNFTLDDDEEDESSTSEDSSDSSADNTKVLVKEKAPVKTANRSVVGAIHNTSTTTRSVNPSTAEAVSNVHSSNKPIAKAVLQETSSKESSDSSATSSSDSSTDSNDRDSNPLQANGSAIPPPSTKPTTNPTRDKGRDSESDDTDIVKADATPPKVAISHSHAHSEKTSRWTDSNIAGEASAAPSDAGRRRKKHQQDKANLGGKDTEGDVGGDSQKSQNGNVSSQGSSRDWTFGLFGKHRT